MSCMAKEYGEKQFSQRVWAPAQRLFKAVVESMTPALSKPQYGRATEVAMLMFCRAKRSEREKAAKLLDAWKRSEWSLQQERIEDLDAEVAAEIQRGLRSSRGGRQTG